MKERTPFPQVFWVANTIEILERFAYYGIYFGFGIYMEYLGYSRAQLGIVQIPVSRFFERFRTIPSFVFGLLVAGVGLAIIGYANVSAAAFVFLGIFLFATGEMISSPRIQEYICWIAPKEKAGLYTGLNFLYLLIGAALSGIIYTTLYGFFRDGGHPEHVWYVLARNMVLGMIVLTMFTKTAGEFKEQDE